METKRKPHWAMPDKVRAMTLEAFVTLFSFPFAAIPFREIVMPQRRCADCGSRFITTIDKARVHALTPNGLAMEASPSLHRCLRCHELTVFVSAGVVEGRVLPYEQHDEWLDVVFPGFPRC